MTSTISITDGDLDALRAIRDLAQHRILSAAQLATLDRILAAAGPAALDVRDADTTRDAGDRRREDRICPECGGACLRDAARLVWNCSGCLATFTDESQLGARALRALPASQPLATAVTLDPLPRGGHAVFTFADCARSVYLPGRRFQLVWALLVPSLPHIAGELIPDADLIDQVWDDDPALGGRRELNVLITRCRQDLVGGGIPAPGSIERAPGGGATRMRLAPGARVSIATDAGAAPATRSDRAGPGELSTARRSADVRTAIP